MNDDRLHVRVGAITLLVLAAAAAGVLALEGRHLRPGVRLEVEMERIGNLQVGAAVKLAGLTLGSVNDIQLVPAPPRSEDRAHVLLHVWVDARHRHLVRETTDFFINQEGLLGDSYLGIAERPGAGEPGPPLAAGTRVRGVAPPQIDKLLTTSYANLEAATRLLRDGLPEIDLLETALADLERNLDELPSTAPLIRAGARLWSEGRQLSSAIPQGAGAETVGLARDVMARQGRAAAALSGRLEAVSRSVDRIGGRLGDPRARRLALALGRAAELVAKTERALGTARALMTLVASGQGSLGAFLKDVELADEMKEMTKIMKRQPWVTIGRP